MNTNTNYTYETEIPDTLLADLPEEARDQENINRVSFTYWQTCWKRMKKDKLAMFGIVVIIAMAEQTGWAAIYLSVPFTAHGSV